MMKNLKIGFIVFFVFMISLAAANAVAPVIGSYTPSTSTLNLTAQNTAQLFNISATDADNETLTASWYINNVLVQSSMILNGSGYSSINYTFTNATLPSAPYRVNATVNDSTSIAKISWTVNVADTESPAINVTYPSNGLKIKTTNNIAINATITDNLNLSKCELYLNSTLNSSSNITGTSKQVSFPLSSLPEGNYSYYLKCADKAGNNATTSVRSFDIDIINDAPVMANISGQSIPVNRSWAFQLSAYDSNNDNLTYSITTAESGVTVNPSTGLINYTGTNDFKNFTINASVSDGRGGSDSKEFNVEVRPARASIDVTAPGFVESDRQVNSTATFTIINTGDVPLTNITITNTADAKYKVDFQNVPSTIAAGQSKTVTLVVYMPDELDAGSTKIGTFTVSSNETSDVTTDITVIATNELVFKDLSFKSKYHDSVNNIADKQSQIISIVPGDELTIEMEIKNGFSTSDNYDWDIENIQVILRIEGIDDGNDIEYEFSQFDLDAQGSRKLSYTFNVPYGVEDDEEYPIEIEIESEDENGAEHNFKWVSDFEGKRESNDIEFTKLNLSSAVISCDRNLNAEISIINIGTRDEESAALYISSPDLMIEERETFYLDSDPSSSENLKTFNKQLSIPPFKQPGSYTIWFTTYFDVNKESMRLSRTVTVKDCVKESAPVVTVIKNTTQPVIITPPKTETKKEETKTEKESSEEDASVYMKRVYGQSGVASSESSLESYDVIRDNRSIDKKKIIIAMSLFNIVVIGIASVFALKAPGNPKQPQKTSQADNIAAVEEFGF